MFRPAMHVVSVLLALAALVVAKPLAVTPRDAISPPITSPTADTVWKSGETQTVTWDLSGLNGAQPSNPNAQIILGTFVDGQEHLLLDSPLASGFSILDGNVTLVVPTVTTGSDYIVCLFGSSGDISPAFMIIGTDASASASTNQQHAATSSNTLPPHETTDPVTSSSLPSGVVQTSDSATSTALTSSGSSSVSATSSLPSATSPSGTSSPSGSTVGTASSASGASSSASTSALSSTTGAAGNFGSKTIVTNAHLLSAFSGALAFWVFL